MPFGEPSTGASARRVTVTATPTKIADVNGARVVCTVRNVGAADCDLGPDNTVAAGAGFLLTSAGLDSLDIAYTGTIYGVTASGTTVVCVWEEVS
jgi:hypothetical protein